MEAERGESGERLVLLLLLNEYFGLIRETEAASNGELKINSGGPFGMVATCNHYY